MGKFSRGMSKYGKGLQSAFTWDKDEKKELKRESKLNHAEAIVTLPARLVLDPLIGATALAGGVVVGGICIPLGLLFSKGLFEVGVLALAGGAVVDVGGIVVCPIANILLAPYNGIQAFRHRDKHTRHENVKESTPSSFSQGAKNLRTPANEGHWDNEDEPIHTVSLFQKNKTEPNSNPTGFPDKEPTFSLNR
ncbi:hypothetical protein [Legionella longbeachae]|uniref:hypothetical protein n=1 Tax=Legionella longbeachae TaxID=450 RepID=UPI000A1C15BB|nr:hypothetical protein [Legionella longbeachae]ARM33653.1 hypothetical protein B0B39_08990 [Legionella longbeachae]HBD7397361.1 hypothetical protein [Legionella pneumophila]